MYCGLSGADHGRAASADNSAKYGVRLNIETIYLYGTASMNAVVRATCVHTRYYYYYYYMHIV